MDAEATVRAYYDCLDDARYDDLRDVLAPGFTQRRPDRTFPDREAFLSFVVEDRPHTDTVHELDGVFVQASDDAPRRRQRTDSPTDDAPDATPTGDWTPTAGDEAETVFARGTVVRDTGDVVVRFVDCFDVLADRIVALDTYTR
jgi:ketosteroid isomerase-like protein